MHVKFCARVQVEKKAEHTHHMIRKLQDRIEKEEAAKAAASEKKEAKKKKAKEMSYADERKRLREEVRTQGLCACGVVGALPVMNWESWHACGVGL